MENFGKKLVEADISQLEHTIIKHSTKLFYILNSVPFCSAKIISKYFSRIAGFLSFPV